MKNDAYQEYETTKAWKVIDDIVSALVANQDIMEMTNRRYIVGFLVMQLIKEGIIDAPERLEGG